MLQQLTWNRSVNKALIVRMVQYAMTNCTSCTDAQAIVDALRNALIPTGVVDGRAIRRMPNVDRYSVAIKTGLIEMCLKLIVRFGRSNGNDLYHRATMLDTLGAVLNGASGVALCNKPAKALSDRRSNIQDTLRSAVGVAEGKSFELVEKVRSIVSINTQAEKKSLCCRQVLQADQIKMCSKCHRGTT